MALIRTGPYGASYAWGFNDASAPVITGFTPLSAELKWEPEIRAEAKDTQGTIVAVVRSQVSKRKTTGEFTGLIQDGVDPGGVAASFIFEDRFFIVSDISAPRKKGVFTEITLSAESFARVNS